VIAGTPSYMSPEQAAGRSSEAGPAADIYSLGAILYDLLTGEPPFRAESPMDVVLQVLGTEPTPPRRRNPRIPRSLELICMKCLSKPPEDRYPSAGLLADDLERLLRGEPLWVQPPHMGQQLGRWVRRYPALASRIGALGLLYLVETSNYAAGMVDWSFHQKISIVGAVWVLASVGCQQLFKSRRWSNLAPFVWGTLDSVLLLAAMFVGHGVASALVVCYPLLIAVSGLWFRVRFVWFMTGLSLASYGILVVDFYFGRTWLRQSMDAGVDRHVIFAVALVVLGAIVAYLVQRVRVLGAFYGQREP